MQSLACVGCAVVGALLGVVGTLVLALIVVVPTELLTPRGSRARELASLIALLPIPFGAAIGFMKPIWAARKAAEAQRTSAEAAEARSRAAAEADARRRAAARAAAIAKLRQVRAEAQTAAHSLPVHLAEATLALDRAENELTLGLYSPFWEAVEAATLELNNFYRSISSIEAKRREFFLQLGRLDGDAPALAIDGSILPDPGATHQRLVALYRKAQASPHYAVVYEQRRTSAILVAGFNSLGQAIERLGDRIDYSMSELTTSLDLSLVSLEESLEASASVAAEQSQALLVELQRSNERGDDTLRQLRAEANARSEEQRLALRMLDNIQRRRKP